MVTILLALIGLIVSTPMVLAADCFGGQGQSKYASYAWKLRAQICGSNACAQSDSINGNNQFCTLSIPADDGATIELQRGDPSGQYTNCYGGYENILNECLDNASGSGLSGDPNGKWTSGDEWYWITVYNPPAEGVVTSSTIGSQDTILGPTQFCQGLAPGGSGCVDVPKDCYIDIPIDNTVPKANCDPIPDDA